MTNRWRSGKGKIDDLGDSFRIEAGSDRREIDSRSRDDYLPQRYGRQRQANKAITESRLPSASLHLAIIER